MIKWIVKKSRIGDRPDEKSTVAIEGIPNGTKELKAVRKGDIEATIKHDQVATSGTILK